jgi:hypothetical protein
MAKPKKEKIQEVYQFVDQNNVPVKFEASWSKASITSGKVGKLYKTKAAALRSVRKAIREAKDTSSFYGSTKKVYFAYEVPVTKEEWIEAIFKLKIQVFRAVSTEDLTFYLDKLN